MSKTHTEKLFSYGTLRYEAVQLANFGRKLEGQEDTIQGFRLSMIEIQNPEVIETSGEPLHPIITYTGEASDSVRGIVFDISQEELAEADKYEVSEYKRVNIKLNSGINAWVYIDATNDFEN